MLYTRSAQERPSIDSPDHHQGVLPEAWAAAGIGSWVAGKLLGFAAEAPPIDLIPAIQTGVEITGKVYEYGGIAVAGLGCLVKAGYVIAARRQS